jgi:hypothetical protein
MKKKWMVAAILVLSVSLGIASSAMAQGAAGAGAGAPTTAGPAKAENTHSSHSLNPIRWVKRSSKPDSDAADARTQRDKKLTAVLFAQGLLGETEDVNGACSGFHLRSECVAALHASHNLGLDFHCLKADLTGVPAGTNAAACKETANGKAIGLRDVIHELKPEADAAAESQKAEEQAQADLKQAGA